MCTENHNYPFRRVENQKYLTKYAKELMENTKNRLDYEELKLCNSTKNME